MVAKDVGQVVDHLPSKLEAPSSNPNNAKKKKNLQQSKDICTM
jgi:hypothetical protein